MKAWKVTLQNDPTASHVIVGATTGTKRKAVSAIPCSCFYVGIFSNMFRLVLMAYRLYSSRLLSPSIFFPR